MTRVHILIYRYTPMLTGTWLISRTCNQGAWITPYRSGKVICTKIFWGLRKGPNDGGFSRKQYEGAKFFKNFHQCCTEKKALKNHWLVLGSTIMMLILFSRIDTATVVPIRIGRCSRVPRSFLRHRPSVKLSVNHFHKTE